MIGRAAENKTCLWNVTDANHNSSIGTGDCYTLIQSISQGADAHQRIGDKIKPKYLRVSGFVSLMADSPSASPGIGGGLAGNIAQYSPLLCRIIAFTQNDIKSAVGGGAVDVGALLRGPSGTTRSFDGTADALLYPVNTDKFKVLKDKRVPLIPVPGIPPDGSGRQVHFFSFNVKCPSTLKYDPDSADVPNNFAPFIAFGYAYANRVPADIAATPVRFQVKSQLTYEDA